MLQGLLALSRESSYVLDQLVAVLHAAFKVSVHPEDNRIPEFVTVQVAVHDLTDHSAAVTAYYRYR